MKKAIVVTDEVKRLAESYSIPPDQIACAYTYECAGGYGGTVIVTQDDVERHQGCGHPMCTMCEFRCGVGVGNEACRDFAAHWIRGGNMPPYVKLFISNRIDIARASEEFSKKEIGFGEFKRIVRENS